MYAHTLTHKHTHKNAHAGNARAGNAHAENAHAHAFTLTQTHTRACTHTHQVLCSASRCLAASTLSDPETLAHLDALDRLPDYHDFGDHCSQIPDHPYTHTRIHAHAHAQTHTYSHT